jgi:hypothetical protein
LVDTSPEIETLRTRFEKVDSLAYPAKSPTELPPALEAAPLRAKFEILEPTSCANRPTFPELELIWMFETS